MELTVTSQPGDELIIGSRPQKVFDQYRLLGAMPISATADFGDLLFQHFAGKGFDIWYSIYGINKPVMLAARADVPALELHIPFQNKMVSDWDGIEHKQMDEKQFDVSFTPFIKTKARFDSAGEYHTFDIHYHKETLQAFAPYFPSLDIFLGKVEKGEPASLLGVKKFLSADMVRVVNELLHFDFVPAVAPSFYESKTMELLILMLKHISAQVTPVTPFSAAALDSAHHARAIILANLEYQYSVHELAKKTGTNVFTLKTAFKHLYGNSLFKFGVQARMDFARQLLINNSYTISEIAWLIGYQEVQSFSTAFKRHFHVSPGDIKGN